MIEDMSYLSVILSNSRYWQVVLNRRFDIEGLILEHIINSAGVQRISINHHFDKFLINTLSEPSIL